MTYWKLPQCLEPVVAWYLGQTGKDLFRHDDTDIIYTMSTDPQFLEPLSKFRKRIAFANAFSTDFAVHTATAAFLVDQDDENDSGGFPTENHCLMEEKDEDNDSQIHLSPSAHFYVRETVSAAAAVAANANDKSSVTDTITANDNNLSIPYPMAKFTTSASWRLQDKGRITNEDGSDPSGGGGGSSHDKVICQSKSLSNRERTISTSSGSTKGTCKMTDSSLSTMATTLDSLGWTKIFVDVRPHIPALWRRAKPQQVLDHTSVRQGSHCTSIYSSATLKNHLSGRGFDGNTLPFGHSFLVASTKNWWYTWFYRDGRRFVDQVLAKELVDDLLQLGKEITF
jgi:hypothetical protein